MAALTDAAVDFFEHVQAWYEGLESCSLAGLVEEAGGAERLAVFSVDVVKGFCEQGPLASERVGRIVGPITRLFRSAYEAGIRDFYLTQDTHPADSPEFADWPGHCVAGTDESEMVDELASLPFAGRFRVLPKQSISSDIGTDLDRVLNERAPLGAAIAVGDCTDLCLYQLAMHLRLRGNALGLRYPVVVPADCVETYDLPLEAARELGVLAHPGDLLHILFLYHMRLNGIRVVGSLT